MEITILKPNLILALFIVTLSTVATYALASNDDPVSQQRHASWLSKQEIAARLGAMGYQVHRLEAEDGCVEAFVSDRAGRKTELYVDPTTGKPGCRGKYQDSDD
jgi:hypothetical protein